MIKAITSESDFEKIKKNWDDIYDICNTATPFQAYNFVKTNWDVWKPEKAQLFVICHHKKEEWPADAIFPCYIIDGILKWIDFHCDFCEPLYTVTRDEQYELFNEVIGFILNSKVIHKIDFSRLKPDCLLGGYLLALCKHVDIKAITGYSIINIKGEEAWISNMESLSKKKQRNLKDAVKKINFSDFKIYQRSNAPFPESDVNNLANYMTKIGIRDSQYLNAKFVNYLKRLYESGILWTAIGYENNVAAGCMFILPKNDTKEYIEWIMLYREKKHNLFMMKMVIDALSKTSIPDFKFNMANGLYPYKLTNFHPSIYPTYRVRVYSSSMALYKSELRELLTRITTSIKFIIKHKLSRW